MKHFCVLSRTVLALAFLMVGLRLYANDTLIDGMYYTLDANTQTATLTSATDNTVTTLLVPSAVDYNGITYTVTQISGQAFADCPLLQSLAIPSSVKTISSYRGCLYGCNSLKNLTLQDGGTPLTFNDKIYSNITLESLYLGRNIIYNGDPNYGNVFAYSKSTLSSVTIGANVTVLNDNLFDSFENLTLVELPHVKTIGKECFKNCSKLTTLTLGDALDSLKESAFSGCTNLTNLQFPSTIKYIGDNAFYNCSSITSASFPANCTLDHIGAEAFKGCVALTAFKCPEAVSFIGRSAFQDCKKLVTVSLGKQLSKIEVSTFEDDVALSDMTVPEGIVEIGDYAFSGCTGITSYSLPSTLQTIGNYVFYENSGLVRLNIPGNVTTIGKRCFVDCPSLAILSFDDGTTNLKVDDDVQNTYNSYYGWSYRHDAFQDCPLRRVHIGRDIYGTDFHNRTTLKRVTFGDDVTYLADSLFKGCSALTSVSLPKKLKTIRTHVFAQCSSLTSINFPGSVENIGRNSFDDCTSITSVTFEDGNTSCSANGFFYDSPLQSIYVGRNLQYGSLNMHSKDYYSPFHNIKTLVDVTFSQSGNVTMVYRDLLRGCSSVTAMALPHSLQTIGERAFSEMSRLKDIVVYDSVTMIGYNCFANDTAMSTARLSDNLTTMEAGLFYNCSKLDGFAIPKSVTAVKDSVFEQCASLSSITFPVAVSQVGNNVFNKCSSLKEVYFDDGSNALTIGYNKKDKKGLFRDSPVNTLYLGRNLIYDDGEEYSPFAYITSLDSLTLGTQLTSVGKYAFTGCTSIPRVFMPDNITSVGLAAFKDCASLSGLTLSGKLVSVGEQSFMNCTLLENVSIPATLDALSSETFAGCSLLKDVDLGSNLNTIGPGAFENCTSLQYITIPKSVYGFGVESFKGCTALRYMDITEGIKSIGKNAFNGCTSLEGVKLSKSLVSIGDGAFTDCNNLMYIFSWNDLPPEGLANFPDTVEKNAMLYVPEDAIEDYKDSPTWENFFHMSAISSDIKMPQTIALNLSNVKWSTDSIAEVGDSCVIELVSSASLPVSYAVTEGSDIVEATTTDGKLYVKVLKAGRFTITASASGNDIYYSATQSISISVNEPTAIQVVKTKNTTEDGYWYTLQGIRLSKRPTASGVYIYNGKKVIVKNK